MTSDDSGAEPKSAPGPPERLESWKDVAAYLKRDVSTVQRWERREGLPIRRHQHDKLGSVVAFRHELDEWRDARARAADGPAPGADAGPPAVGEPTAATFPPSPAPPLRR